jgi:hypothetical protein
MLPAMHRIADMTRSALSLVVSTCLILAAGVMPVRADSTVDLELVLAVDVSLSMDIDEQRLQRDGYVEAFRDPDVQRAILSGLHKRIAVTYFEWAGDHIQQIVVPWTLVDSPMAALALAEQLAAFPISRNRFTSISSALEFAVDLLEDSPYRGLRRVVDVSGDGPNNQGAPIHLVRDKVVQKGIVINGLPIMIRPSNFGGFASYFDIPDLDVYYTACVVGGPGSFVIPVRDRGEFATAIRRKLILEIAGRRPASGGRAIVPVQNPGPGAQGVDCLVGEKLWDLYMRGQER